MFIFDYYERVSTISTIYQDLLLIMNQCFLLFFTSFNCEIEILISLLYIRY